MRMKYLEGCDERKKEIKKTIDIIRNNKKYKNIRKYV